MTTRDCLSQVETAGLMNRRHRHARFYAGRTNYDERVYVKIELRRTDLPVVPVELRVDGECFDGNDYRNPSGGGQIDDMVRDVLRKGTIARGCTAERLTMILTIWQRWHMNTDTYFFGRENPERLPDEVLVWLRPLMDRYDVGRKPLCLMCDYGERGG